MAVTVLLVASLSLPRSGAHTKWTEPPGLRVIHQIDHSRAAGQNCRYRLEGRRWPVEFLERHTSSLRLRRWVLRRWNGRARVQCGRLAAWLSSEAGQAWAWYSRPDTQCVVAHEGGWRSLNPWGYAGRFQMDRDFELAYGREWAHLGRASSWPHTAQVVAAYRGFLARGFQPWPTYARYCA